MKKVTQLFFIAGTALLLGGCDKYLDINDDPNNQKEDKIPLAQVFTSVTLNVGFTGGSDVQRYTGLLMQQYSGQTTGGETQTQQYEKYLIQATELNNLFSSIHATTLNDISLVIKEANAENAPHYAGVAKLLKAFTYHLAVDVWGKQPYSDAQGGTSNLFPKYDDDVAIYTEILKLIDEGIADINQATSLADPGTNSTIYSGDWATKKTNWLKFANTLKLRLYLHYSKLNQADAVAKITALVNANPVFMASTADNFEHPFLTDSKAQNPIQQFELNRT
ncbi:MAG: SusD/RagB family nutrient-binding outer membrane lipoprotein, partial [Chitinophagaceae bacterium]|nr:SusD/RagB family nutrient-binding outer membrane lipoprotein [Chitinophagaceae bacterium]